MSDVREQLVKFFEEFGWEHGIAETYAHAALERFDVVEKPVVTDEALGRMVVGAYQGPTFDLTRASSDGCRFTGVRMQEALEAARLRIVKADAE